MNRFILFIFILASIKTLAQNVAIETSKTSYLIAGFENPMRIVSENIPCQYLEVSSDDDIIIKLNQCDFFINPRNLGQVNLSIIDSRTGKILEKKKLRVKKFPNQKIYFKSSKNGFISKTDLISMGELYIPLSGFDATGSIKALSFKYKIINNGITKANRKVIGGNFDQQMNISLYQLKHNDIVIFYDVEIKLPGDVTPTILDPCMLIVKEYEDENISEKYFNFTHIPVYLDNDTSKFLSRNYEDGRPMVTYEKLKNGNYFRKFYNENGSLFQKAEVKFYYHQDTVTLFDPETYEQKMEINKGYLSELNGYFTQYHNFYDKEYIELAGSYVNGLQGTWVYCTYPNSYGIQECYEAAFKDGELISDIVKKK
jgi:hypothetical protein